MKKVDFVDLKAQYKTIQQELQENIDRVIESCAFIGGPFLNGFEKNFADFCGVKHAIGVSSGTSALHLALTALGIGKGDEVIVPVNTFIATVEAIVHTGAKPVFVDMDSDNYNIAIEQIESKVTDNTAAILPVHLYGQPVDMDKVLAIAKRHKIFVVEDACQAHGAGYNGRKVGSIGDIAAFSFYPGKNLGAYGDGGMVTTNNSEFADKVLYLKDHGSVEKYYHKVIGYNYRLDGMQAAILDVKLRHLPDWNESRRKNAALYTELLQDVEGVKLPTEIDNASSVYHLYVIQVDTDRDELREYLGEQGIASGLHYPVPCHLQPAFSSLGYKEGDFPESERYAKRIISLPMFPELSPNEIEYGCEHIKSGVTRG